MAKTHDVPSALTAPVLQVGVARRVRDVLRPQVGKRHDLRIAVRRREYPEHLSGRRPYPAQVVSVQKSSLVWSNQRRANLVTMAHTLSRHTVIDDFTLAVVGLLVEAVFNDLRCPVVEVIRLVKPFKVDVDFRRR